MSRDERLNKIASDYAREPQGALVISPDNESRHDLNGLIHREMQERGNVSQLEHTLRVLDSRQEMTGADRQWAGQYEEGDVVRDTRGSRVLGIEPGEYARGESVDTKENRVTIERENGEHQTYNPHRLAGVAVYHETERAFSEGDRIQFTAHRRTFTLPIASWAPSRKSTARATSKSAWTQDARSHSTSASIRIWITVTR